MELKLRTETVKLLDVLSGSDYLKINDIIEVIGTSHHNVITRTRILLKYKYIERLPYVAGAVSAKGRGGRYRAYKYRATQEGKLAVRRYHTARAANPVAPIRLTGAPNSVFELAKFI